MTTAGPGLQTLDVNFINPFLLASMETLKTKCRVASHVGGMFLKGKAPLGYDVAVTGKIDIKSPTFSGSVSLCFTDKLFFTLMSNMLGETHTKMSPKVEASVGELVSIVFSYAKKLLAEAGFKVDEATPTISTKAAVEPKGVAPRPTLVVPFQTAQGAFHIEISV